MKRSLNYNEIFQINYKNSVRFFNSKLSTCNFNKVYSKDLKINIFKRFLYDDLRKVKQCNGYALLESDFRSECIFCPNAYSKMC